MKLLLDTHTFIWWATEPERLSQRALSLLEDDDETPIISVVNLWEIQIKSAVGKLDLEKPLSEIVSTFQDNGIEVLPIRTAHVMALSRLPNHHQDPFDRILMAQAITEDMAILSKDAAFKRYPVQTIW